MKGLLARLLDWMTAAHTLEGPATAHRLRVRRATMAVLVFTAIFYLPSLRGGFMADDWFHRLQFDQIPELFTNHINIFNLVQNTDELIAFKHFGLVPWWASNEMRINFWRPIPSITHYLEYLAVGHNPAVAHLVSIGFYVFAVYLVYRVLTRFIDETRWALALAVLIFAVDDAHALNIEWIANRNETIGGAFVLLSLLAWFRYRERKGRMYAPLICVAYAAALLSKESTLVLPLFLVSHALVFPDQEGSRWFARIRPHLLLFVVLLAISGAFLAIYFGLGHGANSVYYINPLKNPGLWATQFFRSGFYHSVILATGVPLHVLSSSPALDYPLAAVALGVATVGFWILALKWLRHDRPLRFFILTMLAGQAILTTSYPDPRNLFLPSIGFAYMVARVMEEAYQRWRLHVGYKAVVVVLAALHLVFAAALCQACIVVVNGFEQRYQVLKDSLTKVIDYQQLPKEGKQVYFLNWHQREITAVVGLYLRRVLPTGVTDYTPWIDNPNLSYVDKLYQGLGAERIHYYCLSFSYQDVNLSVLNDKEFLMSLNNGHYFPTLFEELYTTGEPFEVGQQFDTGAFKATITNVSPVGHVLEVRFSFPQPLSSDKYVFMKYNGKQFVPVKLTMEH